MGNVLPPNKDIHETYDLKVNITFFFFFCQALYSRYVLGLNYWSFLTRRRDQEEPLCSYEGFELGEARQQVATWPSKT